MGRAGPPLSHAAGRRQASLGTPVPRTPTWMDDAAQRSALAVGSLDIRTVRRRNARRQRDQGGVHHEVPVTQAMTTKGARRVPARTVSSFPLWCKGGKRSRGVPRHQAKVAISVQRDQDQEDCKMEVIVEPRTASSPELCAGEDYFCQDS